MRYIRNIVYGLLFIFLVYALTRSFFDYNKNMGFYQSYKSDYEKELKKNTTLKTQILKNKDPYELEKTIRNRLNLGRTNETTVILPNPTPTPTPGPSPKKSWIDYIRDLVGAN